MDKDKTTNSLNSSGSLALNPWTAIPSLGNIEEYISAANHLPFLTLEEEQQYARDFQDFGDLDAASKLVLSHLRFVIAVARQYSGYGLVYADLIQEGNIGLMKAVKRFDPDQGVRLVSYAVHWIKSEIHEFILKNWRIVKIATTKAQRKLFFNLRSLKHDLKATQIDPNRNSLSETEVNNIAEQLDVKPREVEEMNTRLSANDVILDPTPTDSEDESFGPISYLTDVNNEPSKIIEAQERQQLATTGIQAALQTLDPRSQRIIEERWLKAQESDSNSMTLHELAAEFQVSAERIRQIEVAAMKKIRKFLEDSQR